MTPPLIALYSSAPRSGKTEVAKALQTKGFKVLKFASPLKDMIRSLARSAGHGEMEIEEMLEGALKETPLPTLGFRTPRYLMQTLGTEWGRNLVSETLWTDLLLIRAQSLLKAGHPVVVDDMRFPNEYQVLKALGAHMVWVKRPGVEARTDHGSEGALDSLNFDVVIANDSDVKALHTMTYAVCDVLCSHQENPTT